MPEVSSDVPDETTRVAILSLANRIAAQDGSPPLSDDALTHLSSPDVDHLVAREDGQLVGYGQRRDDSAEVAAEPEVAGALVDALRRPGVLIWAHGRRSGLARVLGERGFTPTRELYQLRRPLDDLPPDPPLPDGVTVRSFQPGHDEQPWLEVNAAAFASHAEQGRRTLAELEALMAEPWFAPWDFLLADRSGELLGFHWTKVHSAELGEVYVLGISPKAQGLGLGNALLVRGLRHLAERGCTEVLLYVDGDNTGARRLYAKAGFHEHDLDVQWRLTAG